MRAKTQHFRRCMKWLSVASCILLLAAGNALTQPVRGMALLAFSQEENTRTSLPEEEENLTKTELITSHRAARRAGRSRSRPLPRPRTEPSGSCLSPHTDFALILTSLPSAPSCARGHSINPALRL